MGRGRGGGEVEGIAGHWHFYVETVLIAKCSEKVIQQDACEGTHILINGWYNPMRKFFTVPYWV